MLSDEGEPQIVTLTGTKEREGLVCRTEPIVVVYDEVRWEINYNLTPRLGGYDGLHSLEGE